MLTATNYSGSTVKLLRREGETARNGNAAYYFITPWGGVQFFGTKRAALAYCKRNRFAVIDAAN
jgi:hypothetical protein